MITLEALGWNATWAARFAAHAQAGLFPGRIAVEHKGRYHFYAERQEGTAHVSGRLRHAAAARADLPAVGDWVALQAADDQTAVIHAVLERNNKFSRKPPGKDTEEQLVAANLDTLFLVTSFNRDLNPRRIERYLTAAWAAQVSPALILNKSDLCDRPHEAIESIRAAASGVPIHAVSARTGEGLEELIPFLGVGRTVALLGSSGVGKSTLLNRLLGQDVQAVQAVRADDDRGRHTTTHRELLPLPQGGLLIDNPGMRELQVWDEGADVDGTFADIAALAERCRYPDCRHVHEPRCAVQQAIAEGTLAAERFASYCKLQREIAYLELRHDAQAERERKERDKRIHRMSNKEYRRKRR